MRRASIPFAGILLAMTACGQTSEQAGQPGFAADGFIGPVTYHYDPDLLTPANVRVAFPPAGGVEANAVKLLPARGIAGSPDICPGGAETCAVEVQPGLSIALLERPFDNYEQALRDSELGDGIAPTTVAGVPGIVVDGGTEDGLAVEYRLIPVDSRALLIKDQRDGQSAAEKEALEAVVESLDLGG